MSTRLSTKEREKINDIWTDNDIRNRVTYAYVRSIVAELRESWKERDAACRALRDLTDAAMNLRGTLLAQFAHHTLTGDSIEAIEAFDEVCSGISERSMKETG